MNVSTFIDIEGISIHPPPPQKKALRLKYIAERCLEVVLLKNYLGQPKPT